VINREPVTTKVEGFEVVVDQRLGHIAVYHDGSITWDQLFAIKNKVWGSAAVAIEVYPSTDNLVNACNCRHLWRLGEGDFCPDLLGHEVVPDTLEARYQRAWAESCGVVW
jgi:hypothetical protein